MGGLQDGGGVNSEESLVGRGSCSDRVKGRGPEEEQGRWGVREGHRTGGTGGGGVEDGGAAPGAVH